MSKDYVVEFRGYFTVKADNRENAIQQGLNLIWDKMENSCDHPFLECTDAYPDQTDPLEEK